MAKRFLAISSSSIRTYTVSEDGFDEGIDFITSPDGTGFAEVALSARDKYLITLTSTGSTYFASLWNGGGEDVTWGAGLAAIASNAYLVPHPIDPTLFFGQGNVTNKGQLYRIQSDLSIVELENIGLISVITTGGATWNSDGTRLVVTNRQDIWLYEWDGAALTELDNLGVSGSGSDTKRPSFVPGTTLVFVGTDNDTEVWLYDTAGDSIVEVDTKTGLGDTDFSRPGVSPDGTVAIQPGRNNAPANSRLWPISGNSLGAEVVFPHDFNAFAWISDSQIVTIEGTGLTNANIRLYTWNGSSLTLEYTDSTTFGGSSRPAIIATANPPPTTREMFDITYADAAGREPLATALQQRTPAQNLADYLVSIYAGTNPRIVTKPVQIDLGDLGKTSPAPAAGDLSRQIWIEDDRDPNFAGGRWATILGRSGGADPGTVELTLFIADNPESFVEPT